MSTVIAREKPQTQPRRPAAPARRRPTQPSPTVITRRRAPVRKRAKANPFAGPIACLVVGWVLAYACASILGNLQMESARRDALRSKERTKLAKDEVSRLRERYGRLTSLKEIHRWSTTHGFVPSAAANAPRVLEPKPGVYVQR